jgi:hypothetical protein
MPPVLWAATTAGPMDAMHPHDPQSRFPPNRHGVIVVFRSVVGNIVLRAVMPAIAWRRSRRVSISGRSSPTCGVNRLNRTFAISDLRNFGPWRPEFQELPQAAWPLHHRAGNSGSSRNDRGQARQAAHTAGNGLNALRQFSYRVRFERYYKGGRMITAGTAHSPTLGVHA